METLKEIKSYKDLLIWQMGMSLCKLVYEIVAEFPIDERFGLISQMKRSAISIPSNIAEGYGRNYTNNYIQFLSIARGSLMELETQVILSFELHFLPEDKFNQLMNLIEEEGKMLNSFIKSIKNKTNA